MRERDKPLVVATDRFRAILADVTYKDWVIHVGLDGERAYLQVRFQAPDAETGEPVEQGCRKWFLSLHMTRSEVVQTAFMAILAAGEHECREAFRYRGRAVFGRSL